MRLKNRNVGRSVSIGSYTSHLRHRIEFQVFPGRPSTLFSGHCYKRPSQLTNINGQENGGLVRNAGKGLGQILCEPSRVPGELELPLRCQFPIIHRYFVDPTCATDPVHHHGLIPLSTRMPVIIGPRLVPCRLLRTEKVWRAGGRGAHRHFSHSTPGVEPRANGLLNDRLPHYFES